MLLVAATLGPAHAESAPATAETVRDFMIQDVCLDSRGAVLPGISPLDDSCTRRRNLRPGERLPYHKHDHPSPAHLAAAPHGYQRHDSVPVATANFGTVIEHSFDFGDDYRRFGIFDQGSDGGDIVILSARSASFAATEDGGAGFQLFAGVCEGVLDAGALAGSWIIMQFDPDRAAPLEGDTIAHLADLPRGEQNFCPRAFGAAFTRWHIAPFRYRAVPGQGRPVTLTTLISEHYGGGDAATADHVERFYFTRELGGTRWERWQNAVGNAALGRERIAELGRAFAATDRCSPSDMPAGGPRFVLIDCREWSRIETAGDRAGDPAGFFIAAIRKRPQLPAFFAAPRE